MKNRHVVTALIIAPILAVLSYFLTDHVVGEKPRRAVSGQSYPLAAKSNCRYRSGNCTLENGNLKLQLHIENEDEESLSILILHSNFPLNNVAASIAGPAQPEQPRTMMKVDAEGTMWKLPVDQFDVDSSRLRIAAVAGGSSRFYAETGLVFSGHRTSLPLQQQSAPADGR